MQVTHSMRINENIRRWRAGVGVIAVGALLVAFGFPGLGPSGRTQKRQPDSKMVRVQVQKVKASQVPESFLATGTVTALLNTTLAAKITGRVVSIALHEGESFRQGEPLIELDSRDLSAAVGVADASYRSSLAAADSAGTTAAMEKKTSAARIAEAESRVQQAEAALAQAKAKEDLALAGPRPQETAQTHIAVVEAESNAKLAGLDLDRATVLFRQGAISRQELDRAQNRYDLAKGQKDNASQAENMAREGSRSQDIRAAQDAVSQAKAALAQAKVGVTEAQAAALQAIVRQKDVEAAKAQIAQSSATLDAAKIGLSYAQISAPFDGHVVSRLADPGAMASPGLPLLKIEGGDYRLEASVPENVLSALSLGMTEPVYIEALKGKEFSAKVAEIVPQADAATHSFIVKFDLPSDPFIKSGMFGRVAIHTGSKFAFLIPATSTWERDGLHYVYTVDGGRVAHIRIITFGETANDQVEVLSGLDENDRIIIGPRDGVTEGSQVEEQGE